MSDLFRDEVIALIPHLRAYARAITRNTTDADDLVQDALMRAWRYRSGYAPGTNLKAWLFRILRNELVNQLRARRATVEDVGGKFAAALVTPAAQDWHVTYSELLRALDLLSEETREAVLLVAAAGLTYEEAAVACGCATGTMKSRVNRARQLLTRALEDKGKDGARRPPPRVPALAFV